MKYTNKETLAFVEKAKEHLINIEKQPAINSFLIAKINADTGDLLKDELDKLMLGSIPTLDKSEDVCRILSLFVNNNKHNKTHIGLEYASKLIGAYGDLIASDAVSNLEPLTEKELEWCEDTMFISFLYGDSITNGYHYKLSTLLSEHPDAISGFIKDAMLVDATAKAVKEHGGVLATDSLYSLNRHIPINEDILKSFNRVVFESNDKEDIAVDNELLEVVLIAVNPATPLILELIQSIRSKIKEVCARD